MRNNEACLPALVFLMGEPFVSKQAGSLNVDELRLDDQKHLILSELARERKQEPFFSNGIERFLISLEKHDGLVLEAVDKLKL